MAKQQKNFAKLQQALFARSAKMMSYELRTHREEWVIEHDYVTTKARKQHRKVYRLVGAITSQGLIATLFNQRASYAPPLLIGVTTSSGNVELQTLLVR